MLLLVPILSGMALIAAGGILPAVWVAWFESRYGYRIPPAAEEIGIRAGTLVLASGTLLIFASILIGVFR